MKIFLLDGSPQIRERLRETVSDAGHEVVGEADNQEEALSLLAAIRPEAMILDISAHGQVGRVFPEKVLEILPDCALIALSPFGKVPYEWFFKKQGVAYVFDKYYEFDSLVSLLREWARQDT